MNKLKVRYPLIVRAYVHSGNLMRSLFDLSRICFSAFWLGILRKETLDLVVEYCFDNTALYHNEGFNRGGLFRWEREAIAKYYQKRESLLVAGAGGGREVLALCEAGHDVDGFECNQILVQRANDLLRKAGYLPNIQYAPPDQCPDSDKVYDGIIVGWSVYMLIQGRQRRIDFLKKLRSRTRERSPILLSFSRRPEKSTYFKLVATLGNIFRFVLRREHLDIGDDLQYVHNMNIYVHSFTADEMAAEFREAGFELEFFATGDYGHAIGLAS